MGDFPDGSEGKASVCSAGDPGSIPGWGRSLEKEMTTHSSTIAWKIPWMEEPGRLQSMGITKSRTRLSDFTFTFTIYMRWPQTLKDIILESQCFLPEANVTAPGLAASRKDTDLPPRHEKAIHCPILALGGLAPT